MSFTHVGIHPPGESPCCITLLLHAGGQQQSLFGVGQAAGASGAGAAGPSIGQQNVPSFVAGANTGAFSMGPPENRGAGGRRKAIAVRRRRG